MRNEENNRFIIPEAFEHKIIAYLVSMAINNEESLIAFLCWLGL